MELEYDDLEEEEEEEEEEAAEEEGRGERLHWEEREGPEGDFFRRSFASLLLEIGSFAW
jgi:hypothetical protein